MVNKICRVVGGILIVCLLLFGIYKIMPEQYRNIIDSKIQMLTDEDAEEIIDKYKNARIDFNTNYTYEQMLESVAKNSSWKLETVNEATGEYELIFNGYKINFELVKDDGTKDIQVYTNASLRVVFDITEGESSRINNIDVYINGELQSDHFKQEVFNFLISNIK